MDFTAGDARQIGAAVDAGDDLRTAPFVVAHADFSLHLVDESLDTLFALVCARRGLPPISLQAALVEHVAGPSDPSEQEFSADVVMPALVEVIATLSDDDLRALAIDWTASWASAPNPDVDRALTELRNVCATALARNVAVVFSWSL